MTARSPASWLQGGSHPAENDRNLLAALVGTPGIESPGDLAVTANGTPNMTVNVAAGAAFIKGTETTYQGMYHAFNDATVNLAIAASDPTNPRIDIVVAQVRDAYYSGASNDFRLVVVTGTPAGSPAAPATPADSIVLARVAVGALVTTVVAGNITDYRALNSSASAPQGTLPGGYAVRTTNAGPASTETDVTGLTVTVTIAAGRRIKVEAFAETMTATVATDEFLLWISEGGTRLGAGFVIFSSVNKDSGGLNVSAILTPTAGPHTYRVSYARFSGTGTGLVNASATAPAYILATDIGV